MRVRGNQPLNPSNLGNGQEQYKSFPFYRSRTSKKWFIQYDYRADDGELFSCVRPTVTECREARDAWLEKKEAALK